MFASSAVVLQVDAELSLGTVEAFRSKARSVLSDQDLAIDFVRLEQSDSAALACVFDLLRFSRETGRRLELCNLPDSLLKLAELYGVVELLPPSSVRD